MNEILIYAIMFVAVLEYIVIVVQHIRISALEDEMALHISNIILAMSKDMLEMEEKKSKKAGRKKK